MVKIAKFPMISLSIDNSLDVTMVIEGKLLVEETDRSKEEFLVELEKKSNFLTENLEIS